MAEGLFLDRAAWGANTALARLGYVVPRSQFVGLVVHHTVITLTDYDRDGFTHGDVDDIKRYMRSLQTARPDLGLDVPYSFVVFQGSSEHDYVVCEGRGFERTGAHTAGFNSTRWGVSLAGDYTTVPPTLGMLAGVRWVGAQLEDPVGARETLGHRDVKATACPGDMAYPLLDRVQPPFVTPEEDELRDDQIPVLAAAIAEAIMQVKVPNHDYSTGADSEVPFRTWCAWLKAAVETKP
jgi:hypothetical protein